MSILTGNSPDGAMEPVVTTMVGDAPSAVTVDPALPSTTPEYAAYQRVGLLNAQANGFPPVPSLLSSEFERLSVAVVSTVICMIGFGCAAASVSGRAVHRLLCFPSWSAFLGVALGRGGGTALLARARYRLVLPPMYNASTPQKPFADAPQDIMLDAHAFRCIAMHGKTGVFMDWMFLVQDAFVSMASLQKTSMLGVLGTGALAVGRQVRILNEYDRVSAMYREREKPRVDDFFRDVVNNQDVCSLLGIVSGRVYSVADFVDAYQRWARTRGVDAACSDKEMGLYLTRAGLATARRRIAGARVRVYVWSANVAGKNGWQDRLE